MPLTVGTAGHIDHGKTWLVRALTGKDTDRLPEEQARGISIDLGYAPLELPDGRRLSLVDVPGHERFVRTMIAGATGIDLFLLVIDAQEGARPQTLEHLAVLRLLGVERGVVAVTKSDAVDEETLELALEEARELVPGAEVVAVSAKTGAGLDELRAALARVPVAERDADRRRRGSTSTACSRCRASARSRPERSGRARSPPATCCASSRAGRTVRVRSRAGARRAGRAGRGGPARRASTCRRSSGASSRAATCSSSPATTRSRTASTSRLDELARDPGGGDRARRHAARCPRASSRDGALRAAPARRAVVAARGDRVVLRTETTVGGGVVLDPAPPRGLDRERLELLERGDPEEIVRALVHAPVDGRRAAGARPARAGRARARPRRRARARASTCFSDDVARRAARRCDARLAAARRDEPARSRASRSPSCCRREPWAPHVLNLLELERRGAKAYLPGATAALGERARGAAELERAARGRGDREGRRPRARRVPRGARAACAASATASPSRPRSTTAGRELLPTLRPDHARRRSATRSASAAARRSCCSSATTRTASRCGAATCASCGAARLALARRSGGGRCPSGSSKPVRRGSPTLARFDSGAAP